MVRDLDGLYKIIGSDFIATNISKKNGGKMLELLIFCLDFGYQTKGV